MNQPSILTPTKYTFEGAIWTIASGSNKNSLLDTPRHLLTKSKTKFTVIDRYDVLQYARKSYKTHLIHIRSEINYLNSAHV